jgi:hypothetical protein
VLPRCTSEPERSYLIHEPRAVAFSADGRWLASGTSRVCDLETNTRYGSITPRGYYDSRSAAAAAAFHPRGTHIAIASADEVGQYSAEDFRRYAEQKRKERAALGYDPPDKD